MRDRSRSAGKRAHAIAAKLRLRGAAARDEAQATAATLAAAGGHDAMAGRRRGRLHRALNDLTRLIEASRQIAAQTHQRVAGLTPEGATQRVACTNPTPGRSPRDASVSRSSSATKVRSPTTTMVSCSTTACTRATHPTPHSWSLPSSGSSAAPAAGRAPSPPTAATARNTSRMRCTTSGYAATVARPRVTRSSGPRRPGPGLLATSGRHRPGRPAS
jgi:hypothetical protein